jgi:hypothetical protein
MAEPLVDVDLDALAPRPKRVKLAGKRWILPGDMPMPLFLRIQNYEQRVDKGEDEGALLGELSDELLGLFKVHQPTMKELPEMGVLTLLQSLGAIYGGAVGELPQQGPATPPQRKRTPSKPRAAKRARATSR